MTGDERALNLFKIRGAIAILERTIADNEELIRDFPEVGPLNIQGLRDNLSKLRALEDEVLSSPIDDCTGALDD